MGLISHRVKRTDLKVGDHSYTRSTFLSLISHHGIYVGEDQVVHFTLGQKSCPSAKSESVSFVKTGGSSDDLCCFIEGKSGVIISCLDCFLGNSGSLHRFEYGVNSLVFTAKFIGGTCTTAKSDPVDLVIHRATYLLKKGFKKYDLFSNNCEDFALYCKMGYLECSVQASSFEAGIIAAMVSLPFRLFLSTPTVLTAATGVYCYRRYASHSGAMCGYTKIEVEDINPLIFCPGLEVNLTYGLLECD